MSSPTSRALPLPLPRVDGPKLEPYGGTAAADIDFIRYIGTGDDADSEVWKVSINGSFYALKITQHADRKITVFSSSTSRTGNGCGNYTGDGPTQPTSRLKDTQSSHHRLEPFSCECRAYGRLKQEGREDLTARAYGYVLLTPDQERRVTHSSDEDEEDEPKVLDGDNQWCRYECHRHEPLRAIVKELVDEGTPDFVSAQVPQMYDDLETLHSLGILVRDINPYNYLGGRLIDFSRSWTMCHPCLERPTDRLIRELRRAEINEFWDMIWAWANVNDHSLETPERLKPFEENMLGDDHLGIDPRDYDWRKWECDEDGDQAERKA